MAFPTSEHLLWDHQLPFPLQISKRLILGTWQQIVVIDHDNAPRTREIYVQVIGD